MTTNVSLTIEDVRAILAAFPAWIKQRPGLDFANYGDMKPYRQELHTINKQRKQALAALREALGYDPNPDAMRDAFTAFSGRLEWKDGHFAYCTGQYWPTEYRAAATAVLERYNQNAKPKYAPGPGEYYLTSASIKAASLRAGNHFFSKGNNRFFASRLLPRTFYGKDYVYFVTSEKNGFDDPTRVFTVRRFNPKTAGIDTVGDLGKFTSAGTAYTAAKKIAKAEQATDKESGTK